MNGDQVKGVRKSIGVVLGANVTQSEFGELLKLGGNVRNTIRRWEMEGPTGPAEVALTYIGQGLEAQAFGLPEFVIGAAAGPIGHPDDEYVVRLWYPRFVAVSTGSSEDFTDSTEHAMIGADSCEWLVIVQWLDNPVLVGDRTLLLKNAADWLDMQTKAIESEGKN